MSPKKEEENVLDDKEIIDNHVKLNNKIEDEINRFVDSILKED